MKIPILSPQQSKRFTQYVHSRYGVPFSVMKDWKWSAYQGNVFVFSRELVSFTHGKEVNVFALGMQAFTDEKTFHPTANFITFLGKHITQNMMELPEAKIESFFARKKMNREELKEHRVLSNGWVAVLLKGKVVGSAELKGNHLIPNLPGGVHGIPNE